MYESTTSSRFRHVGSSKTSLSIKKSNGMSTSSPAKSFCSSKQKHSTFEKYGAIYVASIPNFHHTSVMKTITHPIRRNVIRRNPNNILTRVILGSIERQTRLPGQHTNELLLRYETPRQSIGFISVEMHFNSFCVFDGDQTVCFEFAHSDFGCSGETGCGAEHPVEGDCCVCYAYA